MGYLGRKERENLDKKLFGDPERLLFPIQSAKDLEVAIETVDLLPNALVIKQNIARIAKENGLSTQLPTGWEVPSDSAAPIEFALFTTQTKESWENDEELGPVVIKKGKIFEANNYPDKKYGMTPEEMLKAAKDFQPVGMNDSHNNASLLKGKWGKLQSIKVADNGWDLEGEVAVPVWLDNAMKGEPIKVSAEWNRDTKKLEKLAYVDNPRVPDAAIYAAFTQNEIATDPEMKDIMTQWFEQRLSAAGTKTPDHLSGKTATTKTVVDTKKGKTIMGYMGDFKNDVLKALGRLPDEDPKPAELSDEPDDKAKLSLDKKKKEGKDDEIKDEPKKEVTIVMSEEAKEEFKALRDANALQQKQIEALENDKLENEAKKFASDMIDNPDTAYAYPAERSVIVANFIRASKDDQAIAEKVKFTVGKDEVEGTRVDALKALYAVRRPHNLTKESLAAFGAGVLAPEKTEDDDAAAKKQAEDFADAHNRRLQKQTAGKR